MMQSIHTPKSDDDDPTDITNHTGKQIRPGVERCTNIVCLF